MGFKYIFYFKMIELIECIWGKFICKNVKLFIKIKVFVVIKIRICRFVDWSNIYCVREIDNICWRYN